MSRRPGWGRTVGRGGRGKGNKTSPLTVPDCTLCESVKSWTSCDIGVGVTGGTLGCVSVREAPYWSCEAVCGLSVSGSGILAWISALTGVDAVVVAEFIELYRAAEAVVGSGSFSAKRGNREGEGILKPQPVGRWTVASKRTARNNQFSSLSGYKQPLSEQKKKKIPCHL